MRRILFVTLLGILSVSSFAQAPSPTDSTQRTDDNIFMVAEHQAEFIGGPKALGAFIRKNLKHPKSAQGIYGQAFMSFVVEKDGSLTDIQVVKGLHPDCDKEAMRVISIMPAWQPAKNSGKIVRSRFVLPIRFQ